MQTAQNAFCCVVNLSYNKYLRIFAVRSCWGLVSLALIMLNGLGLPHKFAYAKPKFN